MSIVDKLITSGYKRTKNNRINKYFKNINKHKVCCRCKKPRNASLFPAGRKTCYSCIALRTINENSATKMCMDCGGSFTEIYPDNWFQSQNRCPKCCRRMDRNYRYLKRYGVRINDISNIIKLFDILDKK